MKMKIKTPPGWSEQDVKLRNKELLLFEHLLLNPEFNKVIGELKRSHDIPEQGFRDMEEYNRWCKEKVKVKRVRGREEITTLDTNDKPTTKTKGFEVELSAYTLDLCGVLKGFNLSLEWFGYVHNYACFGGKDKLNPYEVYLTRRIVDGVIIHEEITLKFGATMKVESITKRFMGQSLWRNSVEPLLRLMQGYKEKNRRPSRDKTELKVRILKETQSGRKDLEIYMKLSSAQVENIWTIRKLRSRYKKQIKPNS